MTVTIRGIQKADYDYIVSVVDQWWGGPSGEKPHPIFFYELGEAALIAEDEGEVIGFLLGLVTARQPTTGYVHLVGIDPRYRRRGVGKALYERFAAMCADQGAATLKAITTPGNEGSVRFHEALGFSTHEEPNYAGRGRARLVFTQKLSRSHGP